MLTIRRLQLFEFCDQAWLPESIRQAGMGYLATAIRLSKIYAQTAPVLNQLLVRTGAKKIVVLGAGSGGGILDFVSGLPPDISVILTDIFPDREFYSKNQQISYYPKPVDALHVPRELSGIRVMYTAFHHFPPAAAKCILQNAVACREPIAIFEATERSAKGFLIALIVPLLILLVIPLVRPFRWSGLLFTYIFPVIPLLGWWDGLVSTFRTYNSKEFADLVVGLDDYDWEFRALKGPRGENVPCMTGIPK